MGIFRGSNLVRDGLVFYLDSMNIKSYAGTGTNWYDLISNTNFNSSYYTYPTFTTNYFTFVNNGSTINSIYATPTATSTSVYYTRIGWFYITSYSSGAWSPVFQNVIGNNSDLGLTIDASGKLHFRQYTKTANDGTTDGDYGVSGNNTVSLNAWHMGAIVVDRISKTVTFYLDGTLDSTKSLVTIGNASSNTVVIGGAATDSYSGDRMFKGRISSISHYDRILSSSEILQNYTAFKSRYGLS